jgi:hypothetical protein
MWVAENPKSSSIGKMESKRKEKGKRKRNRLIRDIQRSTKKTMYRF